MSNKLLKIALTGGIGCGKSTVEKSFIKLGVPVIDADKIALQISQPGGPAYPQLEKILDKSYFHNNGEIDRIKLRKNAFHDSGLLRKIEAVIHPLVYEAINQFNLSQPVGTPYTIASIPLLLEATSQNKFDRVLVVDCRRQQQIDRAASRDKNSATDIGTIIEQQIDRESRLKLADDILDNQGDLQALELQIDQLDLFYRQLASIPY